MKIKIAVGSTSPHKLAAVQEALQRLGFGPDDDVQVVGCQTESGVEEQPIGFERTFDGAKYRATQAAELNPDALCLGIESGIMWYPEDPYTRHGGANIDLAVIALYAAATDSWFFTTTPGITFPYGCVREAVERGGSITAGTIIQRRHGGDATDPHSTLTKGRVSRREVLVEGIRLALIQAAAAGAIQRP